MQFEIQKDMMAHLFDSFHDIEAACIRQFHPDLDIDRLIKLFQKIYNFFLARKIKRDNCPTHYLIPFL